MILQGLFRPLNNEDLKFAHRLIQLFTSFAKEGAAKIKMGEVGVLILLKSGRELQILSKRGGRGSSCTFHNFPSH